METIFKVGDKVWDTYVSDEVGEVVDIDKSNLPITVIFYDKEYLYTYDGRLSFISPKTLSFTPYKFEGFSQERPKKEPEIGSLCLFSDDIERFNNNIGLIDILEFNQGIEHRYTAKTGGCFKFCKQIEIKEV